jgi:DNA-binding transcriptional regulator YiaG
MGRKFGRKFAPAAAAAAPDRPPGAALLRRCRAALGLSAAALAAELHLNDGRTVRYWEAGRRVPGPVWVALGYMLRARGEHGLAAEIAAAEF